ncbi:hypothetical protein D3H55_19545 [Bacillus salacetis]|uniref:Peptidase M50 domain-containing protein n=1 Tax=Bacillus salacetis TaxID=2315464 RepID=A0A3A1QQ40_9BACI|nr:hypothetical protein [Bacillus salacetis]RIW29191.1 hypothetical protein D3H55_19545 [Bacillus salacetis]
MVFVNALIIYLFLVPLAVLIHELGHAAGSILFTKQSRANVFLGPSNTENSTKFKIGRINFYLRFATFGYCSSVDKEGKPYTERMSNKQRMAFYAGGPALSLIAAVAAQTAAPHFSGELFVLMRAFTVINVFTFLSTSLPYIYPKWRKGLGGTPTDGYRVRKVWRDMRKQRNERKKAV